MTAGGVHIDPAALAAGLGALAAPGGEEPAPLERSLERVIDATRRLFAVEGVGLMLTDEGGGLRYVGASDDAARTLEAAQLEVGGGPCVDCVVAGRAVWTDDLAADARWPDLSSRMVPDRVGAVLGVPTRLGGTVVGSLNVHRSEPYAWDASDVAAVEAHNEVLEGMLAAAVAAHQRSVVVDQLQTALERRIVIERAVGTLSERHAIALVDAFDALRRAARDERRPVADLAARALEGEDVVGDRLPRPDPA